MPADSPWMKSPEAAQYAKRSKQTLAREVNAGRLRAARVGGRGELLFRREWIDAWVEDQAAPIVTPVRRRA